MAVQKKIVNQIDLSLVFIPHSKTDNKELSIIPFSPTNESQINANQIDLGLVSIPHSKSENKEASII